MKVLLIHQHFNTPDSGGPVRSYYLATALAQKGHRVVVITASTRPEKITSALEGIEVVYLPVAYNNRFSFNARAWSFIRFVWSACFAAARFRDFDVCYAISVPLTVGLCARWLKWRYRIPYWFEVGDLWPDAPIGLGYIRNPLFKAMLFRFERSVYRSALGVVALSEPIRDAILRKAPGTRVEVISNMADCDFYRPEAPSNKAGGWTIVYAGTLGAANGLHHLLDCAAECAMSGLDIKFVICGDGAMLDILKSRVSRESLSNVKFTGLLNRHSVRETLRHSNAVFVSYLPAPILETGSPNKYFDGLAAGKLIIVNFGGWIRKEIETRQCGFYVDPGRPDSLVARIRELDPAKQEAMGKAARQLAEEKYSRSRLGEAFAELFEPARA